MMRQLSFEEFENDSPIDRAFRKFHGKHPNVYEELRRLSFDWIRVRRCRWSVDAAYQVLRWQRHMAGLPDESEAFKLNDHYRSRYARLLMANEPELEGLFELRALAAERRHA